MIKGLVTYCARQSLTSFKSSRDEFLRLGIDIHLIRFREVHPRSWPLALACDVRLLWQLLTGRWDFVILNSGASFLARQRLLNACLAITGKRRVPTFVLWRNAAQKFAELERRVGEQSLNRSLAWLADERLVHLAISKQTAREIQLTVGCGPVANIRNCRLMPDQYLEVAPPDVPPVVLNVAGVNHRKAPDRFVATAIKVCTRNLDARFFWVGGAPPAELQGKIVDAGLSDRIRFIDHVDDPFKHMRAAYCLFLTSRQEAFGLVLAEAMACARTAICFAGTGAAEVAGETGRVFDWDADDELVEYLDELLRKPPQQAINLAARQRYYDLYSPSSYARHFGDVIKAHL